MKHEVTTLNTKKTLAASLKRLMEKKPLSKITVSEIINDCGVNRKTFYYHFEDIYALLKWMLEQEAFEVVKKFDLLVEYQDAVLFIMDYVTENKHILNCAYDSMGRDELKRVLANDFYGIMRSILDEIEREQGVSVQEVFKEFLCNMYTESIAGMIIHWIKSKDMKDKEQLIQFISLIMKSSLPDIIKTAARELD